MDPELTATGDDGLAPRRIGAVLREARVAAGIDLGDIARDTRVPLRHLTAIEADTHDNLPALPYAIGFVKALARAVGVDPDVAAAQFRAETSKTAHVPVAPPMVPLDERRLPPRGLVTLGIVGVLAIVGAVIAYSAGAFDPPLPPAAVAPSPVATPEIVAAPPAEVMPAPEAAATSSPAPTATTAPVPAGPGQVAITAVEDAWFRVSGWDAAVGKVVTVKTGVLAKGERYDVPATPGLKLWTGRAGALQLSVDGRALPPLGGPVETVKNVSLDAADLRARLAAAPVAAAPAGARP